MIDRPFSILSFGAGAIGTYIGGSLALNGHSVVFIDQPHIADEIKKQGIKLNIHSKEFFISDPKIYTSLPEALSGKKFDFALFAIKSFDTQAAINQLTSYAKDIPPLLCLQNGVDNEILLEKCLGKSKVIAGTVTSAIGKMSAGHIILEKKRGIGISRDHALSKDLLKIFAQTDLNPKLFTNALGMKWSKMITNLMANATSAILDMKPYDIYAQLPSCQIEVAQLREALSVMSALNIPVVNLPGTPVKFLAWIVKYFPIPLISTLLKQIIGKGRGEKMPSFHIDLYNHNPKLEVDYLNGAVARYGEKAGIPTPVNRCLNNILNDLSSGKLPLDTYQKQPIRLLESINQTLKG
ncbi:MAG: ketopantoate reductase family protein [Chloroflexi bacterium]|nr:ketopantoate reductase family protein [Chloroflexota bacterium]